MLLSDRVVIVTGSARGLGAAVARVLAREGAAVAVNYAQSEEKALGVVKEIETNGGVARAYRADVRDAAAVGEMVRAVRGDFGRIDGLVNNAINGRQAGSLEDASLDDYANAFDFGCRAVINTIKAVRPVFKEQGGGRVVNIVTELWNSAPAGWSVYMAGKGAMVGISRSLAAELGPENITVNMIAPGWMADERVDTSSAGSRGYAQHVPLRRQGSADEIGKGCVFFLSDLASFVTGSYVAVAGGNVISGGS